MSGSADAPPAAQSATVRARGLAPQQVTFTPTRGEPAVVAVVLRPARRISGRVQWADGRPAARATVVVADGSRSEKEVLGDGSVPAAFLRREDAALVVYATVVTAADGAFDAENLPEGPYLVAAQMASRAVTGPGRPAKMLTDSRAAVSTGATDVVLTIPPDDAPPTQPLEVVVTDTEGRAVAKCSAHAVVGSARVIAQPTAEAGRLRFDALPAGTVAIEVSAPGFARRSLADVEIPADAAPAPVAVALDRGVVVRGTVRAQEAALPDGASVFVWPVEQSEVLGGSVFGLGEVREDGSFEMSGLVPGRYRVFVSARGAGIDPDVFVPRGDALFTVAEGAAEVALDLAVVRAGTLSFVVTDPRLPGPPFGGGGGDAEKDRFGAASRVEVLDASGEVVSAHSPVYARFAPSVSLAPGEYTVRLTLAGEAPQEQARTVKAGERVSVRFDSAGPR